MEITLIKTLIILSLSAIFGIVGRSLTKDEKSIYKKKRYFPLFKIFLGLMSLIFIFIDKNISLILISILVMLLFWDIQKSKKEKTE